MNPIAETPEPPYYVVVFTALHADDMSGYEEKVEEIFALATQMPGYIGIEVAAMEQGEISVTYWKDEASIKEWKNNADHLIAQDLGRSKWFDKYAIRVAKVERAYDFSRA